MQTPCTTISIIIVLNNVSARSAVASRSKGYSPPRPHRNRSPGVSVSTCTCGVFREFGFCRRRRLRHHDGYCCSRVAAAADGLDGSPPPESPTSSYTRVYTYTTGMCVCEPVQVNFPSSPPAQ